MIPLLECPVRLGGIGLVIECSSQVFSLSPLLCTARGCSTTYSSHRSLGPSPANLGGEGSSTTTKWNSIKALTSPRHLVRLSAFSTEHIARTRGRICQPR